MTNEQTISSSEVKTYWWDVNKHINTWCSTWLACLHSPLSGMSSVSRHRSESTPSSPSPRRSPCGSPVTGQWHHSEQQTEKLSAKQPQTVQLLPPPQTSRLPPSGQSQYDYTHSLRRWCMWHSQAGMRTRCVWPWWPVRSSPSPAPLHGWGQTGGRCGASGWTRRGATQIDWCPSSGRWGRLHCWSLVICQCCSFAWRVTRRGRRGGNEVMKRQWKR